jgi:hypothetical protein
VVLYAVDIGLFVLELVGPVSVIFVGRITVNLVGYVDEDEDDNSELVELTSANVPVEDAI